MNPIKVDSFIKTNNVIYDVLIKQGTQQYGNTAIDVYCWILNDLAVSIKNDNSIVNKHSITLAKSDTSKIIKYDVIQNKNKRIRDITENPIKVIKNVVFNTIFQMTTINDGKETAYSLFNYVGYDSKTQVLTLSFNPYFMAEFKTICEQQSFNKLQVDIMTSLTTVSSKYVWMYISQYTKQLHVQGCTNWTNINSEDSLFDLLATIKNEKGNKLTSNTVTTIEKSIATINNLIEYRNEQYGLNASTYEIEWKRESDRISRTGKNYGKYSQYRIIEVNSNNTLKQEIKSEDKPKKKTQTCKDMYELVEAALDGEDVKLNYKVITGWFLHKYDLETGRGHGGQFPANIGRIKNIGKQFHLEDNYIGIVKHMEDYITKYKKVYKGFPVLSDFTTAWKVKEVMGEGGKKMSYSNVDNDYVPNTKSRRV